MVRGRGGGRGVGEWLGTGVMGQHGAKGPAASVGIAGPVAAQGVLVPGRTCPPDTPHLAPGLCRAPQTSLA